MADDFAVFKEELKSRVDIVDVVQEYVELKKRGSAWLGLCPFHTEKTPSFNVNRPGQFFHCFGCGRGGDVIGFLMDITGMSFMEAVEQLAERAGMELPARGADTGHRDEKEAIARANLAAAAYWYQVLFEPAAAEALAYLSGRGLTEETIRAFRLGFAPEDTKGLLAAGKSRSVLPRAFEAAGILMPSKYGGPARNRFGGRIIFPIIDQAKRVIGFGGRIMAGDGPKYINSPDSAIYHKGRVLFGIPQAALAIKRARETVVVEGYMDVISLHQAGFTTAIAASGTAFTPDQARIIARMTNRVILLFDGDSAGLAAASRGADSFLATDLEVGIVVLPEGHDPDSYVREKGADALRERCASPMDLWEFKLRVLAENDAADIGDRTAVATTVADSIALVEDDLKRDLYITDLSGRLGINRETMRKAVEGRRRRRRRDVQETKTTAAPEVSLGERELLGYLITHHELTRHFMEEAGPAFFAHPASRAVAEEIAHRVVEGHDCSPSALIGALDPQEARELVAAVAMSREESSEHAARFIQEAIHRFRIREIQAELDDIRRSSPREADPEKKRALIFRQKELSEKLVRLDAGHRW